MDAGLRGKKCLITGGNTGIGLAMAKALASEGVELAVAGNREAPDAVGISPTETAGSPQDGQKRADSATSALQ